MKIIKYLFILLITGVFFASCEKEEKAIMSQDDAYIAIRTETSSVAEAKLVGGASEVQILKIVVDCSDVSRTETVTVDFDFSSEGITKKAIEGTDFVLMNSSKKLSFPVGSYQDTIFIKTINNSVFEGNKSIDIVLGENSASYKRGLSNSTVGVTSKVTIIDDEHPLAIVLGTYTETDYKFSDGSVEAVYPGLISIEADPDDLTKVIVTNFWDGGEVIKATVDVVNKTIVFDAGQVIYVHSTYGDVNMVSIAGGSYVPSATIDGTFDDNGKITLNSWSALSGAGAFGNYLKSVLEK